MKLYGEGLDKRGIDGDSTHDADIVRNRRGLVMATGGWFNHYDDPDEFWDDEPLTRPQATRNTHTPDRLHDSYRGEQAYRSEPGAGFGDDRRYQGVDPSVSRTGASDLDIRPGANSSDYQGSSFATIEVDLGLLPSRVELSRQWNRYVNPADAGDELMRAYKKRWQITLDVASRLESF
ncbi:hypothetical protein ACFVAV_01320 [Nocardia sp. NPDC057663]|uniref:hypothetical protein n=1 Tax=Nocardia sp. NPDC057663 TaxID=3346201 RepID=UPI00366DA07B